MPINAIYKGPDDLPGVIAVFPLPGALLLPRGQMPLNIFEPRYLAMIDDAFRSGSRLIGNDELMSIGELFAEPGVHHGRVQRPAPHTHVEPARARKGSGDGAGQYQIPGGGVHAFLPPGIVSEFCTRRCP